MAKPTPPRGHRGRWQRSPETAARDAEVARLRAQQYTWEEIARELGYETPSGAYRAYQRAIEAIIRPPAEEAVKVEIAKLDALERKAWEILRAEHALVSHGRLIVGEDGQPLPDTGPVLAAIDRVLKVADRRAKLLGLDTPVKADLTVHQVDARDAELIELVNEARARQATEQDGGR